jgi:hypothetical protein
MKPAALARWLLRLVVVGSLAACATPVTMESIADRANAKPIQRVLIVPNGDLLPQASVGIFFRPSVEIVRQLFTRHEVPHSVVLVHKNDLNPAQGISEAARNLNASHALFLTVTKVMSFGPRGAESELSKQFRLVADFTYTLVVTDLQTRRNVWKAEMRSGSGSAEENLKQFEDLLKEHLYRAGLLTPLG